MAICLSLLLSDAFAATLPDNLIVSPGAHPHYVIIVEKASQRLFVYQFNDDYHLVASFPCATGENGGDKHTSGDRRTPEGIYFFTKACDSRFLNATYGARAFPMNYPNLMDERHEKGGYSIWLHGTKEKLKERSTNGCIAMNNADIVRLDPYIKLWDTPIIIQEKLNLREADAAREEGRNFLEQIEGWRQAWSEKDLDRYLSYYSSAFRWQNLDLQGWRQKKERLNRTYQAIQVQLGDIRFFRQGPMVLATFDENYRSDLFASRGIKHLYLAQNSATWRILAEDWRRGGERQPAPLVLAAKAPEQSARPPQTVRPAPDPPQPPPLPQPATPAAKPKETLASPGNLAEPPAQLTQAAGPPLQTAKVEKLSAAAAQGGESPAQAGIAVEPPPAAVSEAITPPAAKTGEAQTPAPEPAGTVPPPVRPAAQPAPRITVASKPPEAATVATEPHRKLRPQEIALQSLVERWRKAWEVGSIQKFMACYHRKFQSDGMNYTAWKRYKQEVFSRSGTKEILLSDLQIDLKRSRAVVTFKQRYQSAIYEDYGLKTLQVVKQKGHWAIIGENWQAL
jgi:murein L,D-transpeptidase YafK